MKALTESQTARLDDALDRLEELAERRPPRICDEEALAAFINVVDTATRLLGAGATIHIQVADEAGRVLAAAPFALEPAAS